MIVLQLLFTYAPPFHAMFGDESLPLRGLALADQRRDRVLPRGGIREAGHSLRARPCAGRQLSAEERPVFSE